MGLLLDFFSGLLQLSHRSRPCPFVTYKMTQLYFKAYRLILIGKKEGFL